MTLSLKLTIQSLILHMYIIYSTELKTQRLIYQIFHSSFYMQTFINLICLFFLDLTFISLIIQIRKLKGLGMNKHC